LQAAPGTGVGGFRPECARWPGGGVDAFLRRVVGDVLPLAEREFGASARRERRAFGGASFGGVAALHHHLAALDLGDFSEHSKPPMTNSKCWKNCVKPPAC
jgi:hypothetical protein